MKLKTLTALLTTVGVMISSCAPVPEGEKVPGGGLHSAGYRMGQLTKYSIRGWWGKTGEGTMLLGNESGPFQIPTHTDKDGRTTYRTLNPWDFSTDVEQKGSFEGKVGEFVWIRYNQAQYKNPFKYGTNYMAVEIEPVAQKLPQACSAPQPQGGYSAGTRSGRVVKASLKGDFEGLKTYEIILQEGMAGSKFIEMSITDPKLYECAIQWLKSGMSMKVDYSQVFFSLSWNKTSYRIWRIQPLPKLQ